MAYLGSGLQRFNTANGLTVSGDAEVTGTVNPSGDTASGDTAAVGFTSTEGLILTGQGSTSDVVIKNDADTTVCFVPTGTDDLKFNDNATLIFGTGSDLTINHDSNNSFITDSGTGALYIQGTNGVFIRSADGGENLASFTDDGSVALNHDNTTRIETTSSGVDITGTSKSDLVIVDSTGGATPTYSHTNNGEGITLRYNDDSGARAADIVATGNTPAGATMAMRFFVNPASTDAASELMRLQNNSVVINEGSADIDFRVEGNGNANAFFVQGSDDFIGIGTGTPKKKLHILDTTSDGIIILDRNDTSTDHQICFAHNYQSGGQSGGNYYAIGVDDSENKLVFAFDANSQASLSADAGMIMDSNRSVFIHNGLFVGDIAHDSGLNTDGHFFQEDGFCRMVRDSNRLLELHRKGNDGELMRFTQGGTEEGSISVSGSSVGFNGGHLSRWSRLLDGSKPSTLVRGTVMSNLDDMIVWSHDAVDAVLYNNTDLTYDKIPEGKKVGDVKTPAVDAFNEDNDQLNHTKVSDTEGDVNVAGVFTAWDNGDDYKDFYLGMTGDMVIRIGKDTTVARGDLLMSAGDGTAKPQGDDIVRSKTIAKVTSITKSHTYDDGTYLVPCVLMAC